MAKRTSTAVILDGALDHNGRATQGFAGIWKATPNLKYVIFLLHGLLLYSGMSIVLFHLNYLRLSLKGGRWIEVHLF